MNKSRISGNEATNRPQTNTLGCVMKWFFRLDDHKECLQFEDCSVKSRESRNLQSISKQEYKRRGGKRKAGFLERHKEDTKEVMTDASLLLTGKRRMQNPKELASKKATTPSVQQLSVTNAWSHPTTHANVLHCESFHEVKQLTSWKNKV